YGQGAPHQAPVHNPYQSAPPQQGWPQQHQGPQAPYQEQGPFQHPQQGPFQHQPVPPVHQNVPLLQNQLVPWSNLAGATPGLHSLPAIHAGTAGPHEGAYVAARHPELPNVNPNRNVPNAVDKGYWHNCSRCVVAYAQRLIGIDSQADPVLPRDLGAFDRMKWLEDQLGARWVDGIGTYDNAIAHVANMRHGDHSVIYVSFKQPDGSEAAHVALAVNTPEGVTFIDPQNGGLMELPTKPTSVSLLPFGSLATSNGVAANPQMALPYGSSQAPHTPAPTVPNPPVQQIPQVHHTPTTPLQHGAPTPTTPITVGPVAPVHQQPQPPVQHQQPPVQQPPMPHQAPVQQPPMPHQAPVQQPPVQQPPVQQPPVQQAPVQQAPVQQAPVQHQPPVQQPPQAPVHQQPPVDPRVAHGQSPQVTAPDVPVNPQRPHAPGEAAGLPEDGIPDPDRRETPELRRDDAPAEPAPARDETPAEPEPSRDGTPAEPEHTRDGTPAEPEPSRDDAPEPERRSDEPDRTADDLAPGDDTVVVDGQTMRIDDAFRRLLDEHPELRDAVDNNPGLRRLLLTNLGLLVNLITYPDAIPVVEEAWEEQLPMPNIPDHVQANFGITPGDHPQQPEQPQPAGYPPATPGSPASTAGIGDHLQPGFDHSRAADPAYSDAYLRDQLARAAAARQELDSALGGIANAVGGTAVPASSPSWDELQRDLAGFDGDASRLTGLASAGMQVGSADDAYRAAAQLAGTPGLEVLSADDRLAQGGPLDMQVRTSDGTVGAVSMMPPLPGMPAPGAAGTSRGGSHRKLDGPQQPLVEDVVEIPTPQYFKCFNKTYKVDRDGDGNLTGFLLNVRTGQFEENSAHLEKVLQDELPSNFRALTESEFIAETERERAFYLRGEGPVFALYATVDGMRKQAKEEGRSLTAQEESFIASVQRRTFGMWEAQQAGFPCTSILA
ncbi:toxin glutamine deamidase domain-containing protein, partial [Amycolatopsis sp. KNN50.9b]|uniref:toxin glutamine deamidase domain-containing protein n=3 Tax=Amycolatopsis TaxID=1813 RepID=UPI000B9D2BE5